MSEKQGDVQVVAVGYVTPPEEVEAEAEADASE